MNDRLRHLLSVVAAMVLAALTLLPAVAMLTHRRFGGPGRPRRAPRSRLGLVDRLLRLIVGHPLLVGLSSIALLVVLALPALGIQFRMFGVDTLPPHGVACCRVAGRLGARPGRKLSDPRHRPCAR